MKIDLNKITIKFSKDGSDVGTQVIDEKQFSTAKLRLEKLGYTVVKLNK
jgi:copper chaperone CopZ